MTRPTLRLALPIAASLSLLACSDGGDGPTSAGPNSAGPADAGAQPAELARLVPESARVFLQVGSTDLAQDFLRGLGTGNEVRIEPAELLGLVGFPGLDPTLIARDRPLGIALGMAEGSAAPDLTLVLPVTDAATFQNQWKAASPAQTLVADGGYVGISTVAGYAASAAPNPLAQAPTHVLSIRAELRELLEVYRPLIDAQMEQAQSLMVEAAASTGQSEEMLEETFDMYLEAAKAMLDSADTFRFDLSRQGSLACFESSMSVLTGSPMDGFADGAPADLAAAAARLDPAAPVSFLFRGNMTALMQRFEPVYERLLASYPEPFATEMVGYLERFRAVYPLYGNLMTGSFGFGKQGMNMAMFLESPEPAALLAKQQEMLADLGGLGIVRSVSEPEAVQVGGHDANHLTIDFDAEAMAQLSGVEGGEQAEVYREMMKAMMGPDGMQVFLATGERDLGVVMSSDDAFVDASMARLDGGAPASQPVMDWALGRFAAASPFVAYRLDLPELMRSAGDAMAGVLPLDGAADLMDAMKDEQLSMLFYGGVEDRTWQAGLAFDSEQLAALVKAVQGD